MISITLFPHVENMEVWFGYQFHRPDLQAGMMLLFRRAGCKSDSTAVSLQSIEAQANYEVAFEGTAETKTLTGVELAAMKFTIPPAPGSLLMFYKKTK